MSGGTGVENVRRWSDGDQDEVVAGTEGVAADGELAAANPIQRLGRYASTA